MMDHIKHGEPALSKLISNFSHVLINFWTDCSHCRIQNENLEKIHKKYNSQLAIALIFIPDNEALSKKFSVLNGPSPVLIAYRNGTQVRFNGTTDRIPGQIPYSILEQLVQEFLKV